MFRRGKCILLGLRSRFDRALSALPFLYSSSLLCSFTFFFCINQMSQIKRVEEYTKKLRSYLEDPVDGEGLLQVVNDIGNELMSNISEDNIGEFSFLNTRPLFLFNKQDYIDNICSILFTRDGPVHAFLNMCSRFKAGDAANAVSQMLDILCTFLKKRKRNKALQKYAKDLVVN